MKALSNVNVDAAALADAAANLKNAITSIESTKAMLKQKYQQLGNNWNDRKYKDLGDIVHICLSALNNIEQNLLKGEKYVRLLLRSLAEYESINLEGNMSSDNAFIQGLRDMTYSPGEASYSQYCLGVLTKGNIPQGYLDIISIRHQNGEINVRRVFDHFANKLLIQNANYPPTQTAHYSPMNYEGHNRGVYYNASSDMTNRRGAGTTYYHELAHMIDHASTGYNGNLSNTAEFGQALMNDGQRVLEAFNNASDAGRQRFINNLRSNDRTHSFQDLLDATTNGQINVGWSHSRDYWRRSGNLQAEAFAHFFEASMGANDKLERFAFYFPTAFAIFSTMIENILPEQRERVLERSR